MQRVWELCGIYFKGQKRFYDAQAIFHRLYEHMLAHQEDTDTYVHKGMPLVWISDSHAQLNHPALSKRYLMLTICEDAIRDKGQIPPETTGVYFRAIWHYGFSQQELSQYARNIWRHFQDHSKESRYPEWILQELGNDWITEYPTPDEAFHYEINKRYVNGLLTQLGKGDGKSLECLAHYLLTSIPGCRGYKRKQSHSTDYDVVCTLEGPNYDFRSELGRYFICECKDWNPPADFTVFAKFCRVLDAAKCRFGILFSKNGISGVGKLKYAEREQLKVFQDRGMVIIVITKADLEKVAKGTNLISMIRLKYEQVRLDLQ